MVHLHIPTSARLVYNGFRRSGTKAKAPPISKELQMKLLDAFLGYLFAILFTIIGIALGALVTYIWMAAI